jgi:hypothetical protein
MQATFLTDMNFLHSNQASRETLSGARWLLFLGQDASRFEDFFTDINIPFDCEFLVVHMEFGGHVMLAEVYRIGPKLPLQTRRLGDLRYQNLYERRNNLQGLAFRSAVIESVSEHCKCMYTIQHIKVPVLSTFWYTSRKLCRT